MNCVNLDVSVPIRVFDLETFPNITSCAVRTVTGADSEPDRRDRLFSNVAGLGEPLSALRDLMKIPALWVGFNNLAFDNHILREIASGVEDAATLKALATQLIEARGKNRRQQHGFGGDEITSDLFAMFKGVFGKLGGLKWTAYKLDAPRHSELPYPHDQWLTIDEMQVLLSYNVLDTDHTERLLVAVQEMLGIRIALAEEYDLDVAQVLNASDSRLAEEVLKVGLFPDSKPVWPPATAWSITGRQIIGDFRFASPELQALHDRIAQWDLTYQASKTQKANGEDERKVSRPHNKERFKFADLTFKLGIGGLHSVDAPGVWEADDRTALFDIDIRSFYPMILSVFGMAPGHLDRTTFTTTLNTVIKQRLAAKDGNRPLLAKALKIGLNSVFGKTKSPYSWLLDPTVTVSVCLIGEMIILQAVELLTEMAGVTVLSVNTDGLMVMCQRAVAADVIERMTSFAAIYDMEIETVEYAKVMRRDGNNYLAQTVGGAVKATGAYGYDQTNLEKGATIRIVTDAVQAFFLDHVPVEQTIRACDDIREFIDYFSASVGYRLEDGDGNDVGGTMQRWYHSTDGITLKKRKLISDEVTKVSGADRVTLVPELPSTLPSNLDYAVYIAVAEDLIQAIVNPKARRIKSNQIALEDLSEAQRSQFAANSECEEPDLTRCDRTDLTRYRRMYDERIKGNRYDSMSFIAWCIWIDGHGSLTRGDLQELVERVIDGEDYWEHDQNARKVEDCVANLAYAVSPFAKPRTSDEILDAALTWAREHVEVAKRKRTMYHETIFNSTIITQTTINKYLSNGDEYKLACAICANFFKYSLPPDRAVIAKIIADVKAFKDT